MAIAILAIGVVRAGNVGADSCHFPEAGLPQSETVPTTAKTAGSEPPRMVTTRAADPSSAQLSKSIESFFALRAWAIFHLAETPETLATIASPLIADGSPVLEGLQLGLSRQAAEGFRIVAAESELADVRPVQSDMPRERSLLCVQEVRPGGETWVSTNGGSTIREFGTQTTEIVLVFEWRRNDAGIWQLWTITEPHG